MRHTNRLLIGLVVAVLLAACGGTPAGGDGDGANGGVNGQGTDETAAATELVAQHGGSTGLMTFVEIGTCFWVLGSEPNLTDIVEIVSCDEEHQYEMFHKVEVRGDDWPGQDALEELATECDEQPFEDYVGTSFDESRWRILVVAPTEEEWGGGQQTIRCALFDPEQETTEGSARDSGE